MRKFTFSSNISAKEDLEFLKLLKEKAEELSEDSYEDDESIECCFLSDYPGIGRFKKAEFLMESDCFFIPSWVELNDAVKEEIRLANKQGIRVRLLSHWDKDDLDSVFADLDFKKGDSLSWNKDIFD